MFHIPDPVENTIASLPSALPPAPKHKTRPVFSTGTFMYFQICDWYVGPRPKRGTFVIAGAIPSETDPHENSKESLVSDWGF